MKRLPVIGPDFREWPRKVKYYINTESSYLLRTSTAMVRVPSKLEAVLKESLDERPAIFEWEDNGEPCLVYFTVDGSCNILKGDKYDPVLARSAKEAGILGRIDGYYDVGSILPI